MSRFQPAFDAFPVIPPIASPRLRMLSRLKWVWSRRFIANPHIWRMALIGLPLALISGCTEFSNSTSPATPATTQPTLRISVLPARSKVEQAQMIAPLDAHLEKVLGQPVEFLIAKNYQDNVEMLVDGRANAAYTGPVSYFEALERGARVVPLVAAIDKRTQRPWYYSCLVVAANSSIRRLTDLKGKRVAFVSPNSTSGYLIPLGALAEVGVNPERDLAAVIFSGNHSQSAALLKAGKVDAYATTYDSFQQPQTSDNPTTAHVRLLWKSAPIPHSPFLVAQDLPPQLVEQLKEAFLTVPSNLEDITGAPILGYTLVTVSDYVSIQILRNRLYRVMEGS